MRDLYYADNRDLVKWGILVELAARYESKHILQVLYYRPTEWADIEVDGQLVALPEIVLKHFRDAAAICGLQCGAQVEVLADLFKDREAYVEIVKSRLRERRKAPGIVFLDPDTGLEPRSPGPEHVLESELAAIWLGMSEGDLLVFYQHQTNRNGEPWIQRKKMQFEQALGLQAKEVGIAKAPKIASDVAFFFAQKRHLQRPAVQSGGAEVPRVSTVAPAVQEILDCLNQTKTRATYAAVAVIIGGLARGVGQRLGRRRPEASWVVSSTTGLPSGYAVHEMHPDLDDSTLVQTGDELRALLKRWLSNRKDR